MTDRRFLLAFHPGREEIEVVEKSVPIVGVRRAHSARGPAESQRAVGEDAVAAIGQRGGASSVEPDRIVADAVIERRFPTRG